MQMSEILLQNYLPYAKDVIMNRAIPEIDGLKPVQRRILYTMYLMKLLKGDRTKSANIVGATMRLHPHGDSAIYDAMVRLTQGNESLNVPYIDGKGNFGKVYSDDIRPAAPRYTEAKLAEICSEMFDGIDENAVDMIPSYDNSTEEPELLPVKFPTVLVNPSSGIAVAMSSNIPSFSLTNVCEATKQILSGQITSSQQLMDVLGSPEFSTGGVFHATQKQLYNLGDTGRQSFSISGRCQLYSNKIVITEIPYNTVASDIVEAINERIKDKTLTEVADVNDLTDKDGFKIEIDLKARTNSRDVFRKIVRLTKLHTGISFNTRCIIKNNCQEIGIYNLLLEWIQFRRETLRRIHQFRLEKNIRQEHMLESWEKIKLDIREVANIIANKDEDGAKEALMTRWNLAEDQAEYILDMKIRMFTQNNLNKKLQELENVRAEKAHNSSVVNSDEEKDKIIIEDMERIIKKFGESKRTGLAEPIPEEALSEEKHVPNNEPVQVVITKKGYMKRIGILDGIKFSMEPDDAVERIISTKNNEYILVFTWNGECHKILVDNIDMSRAKPRDTIAALAALQDNSEAMYITASGKFDGYFNIIYSNGRGVRIYFNRFSGNRSKYRSAYEPCTKGYDMHTEHDKFFIFTSKKKAAYVDLSNLASTSSRSAFKATRFTNERMLAILPESGVPYPELINFERYKKGYTVKVGNDELCGVRLSENDLIRKHTKMAIKRMIERKEHNQVPFEFRLRYDPSKLTADDLAELSLTRNDEGSIELPVLDSKNNKIKLISREELMEHK